MVTNSQSRDTVREDRYKRFFKIVDDVVGDIEAHVWHGTGKPKRKLRGDQLQKLRFSLETLIRDSVAVVHQRKRKGEASIQLNANWYAGPASPADLSYSIHVERAYLGMLISIGPFSLREYLTRR